MRTRLIRIGNSRGVRIPKAFVKAAGLEASLRMRIVDAGLLIERVEDDPRAGWAEAARKLVDRYKGSRVDYGEDRYISIGPVEPGALVVVTHTERRGRIRLISARPASRKERRVYHERTLR